MTSKNKLIKNKINFTFQYHVKHNVLGIISWGYGGHAEQQRIVLQAI